MYSSLVIVFTYVFKVVELDFVFVEQTELEIQLTVFVAEQGERVLAYTTGSCNSYGNGFVDEADIENIERNLIFAVVVREFREIVFSHIVLDICTCFFQGFLPPNLFIAFSATTNRARVKAEREVRYKYRHTDVNETAKNLRTKKKSGFLRNPIMTT